MSTKKISLVFALASATASLCSAANAFFQHNLVSDLTGVADVVDRCLVNPWGVAESPSSPFWISDNGTGLSTLYNGNGAIIPLVVAIPGPGSVAAPAQKCGAAALGSAAGLIAMAWRARHPQRAVTAAQIAPKSETLQVGQEG